MEILDSLFCLLEDLEHPSISRVFVLSSDLDYTHVWSDFVYDEIESLVTEMEVFTPRFTKMNLQMLQERLFFSSLPDLELDNAISLTESFTLEVSSETTSLLGNSADTNSSHNAVERFFLTNVVKFHLGPLCLSVSS